MADDFDTLQLKAIPLGPPEEIDVVYLGRMAEVGKKMIRDSNGVLKPEKKTILFDGLVGFTRILCYGATANEFLLSKAAVENITKLKSRKDRGVLQGDGDNR